MSITIPFLNGNGGVRFYPDELPGDYIDLINVLRSEIPPLQTWRQCAVEYFKQGEEEAFDSILDDILGVVCSENNQFYERSLAENIEGITDINIARAAKELWKMCRPRTAATESDEPMRIAYHRFLDIEKSINKMNEYFWLVKGFVQVVQGDLKGADDSFRQVMDMASKVTAKSKYLFGSLVGKGMVNYHQKRYSAAIDNFTKAIFRKPDCDGSLRILVSACFYRLGQFEKAQEALERSMITTISANQLVLWGLLELETSKKASAQRVQKLQRFRDFLTLAHQIDNTNPNILNMMANNAFHSWKVFENLEETRIVDVNTISVGDSVLLNALEVGDQLRLQNQVTAVVGVHFDDVTNSQLVTISPPLSVGDTVSLHVNSLEHRDYRLSNEAATKALSYATNSMCKAESLYILGKVAQAQNKLMVAYDYYSKASKESHEMYLAHFGAAEILFIEGDLNAALKLFEGIESNFPDDKDTQAYIALLCGILQKKIVGFDKLKEIAPGFIHEYELWLSQGQLRLRKISDHESALLCLTNASKLISNKESDQNVDLLSNIAILDHYLGNSKIGLEKLRSIIFSHAKSGHVNPPALMRFVEFENVFYEWLVVSSEISQVDSKVFNVSPAIDDRIVVGAELKINGTIWRVVEIVDDHQFVAENCFGGSFAVGNNMFFEIKSSRENFDDDILNVCYNFGRILEDEGCIQAASALYEEIIKIHPGFVDVYVRLSLICHSMNNIAEGRKWISMAKMCRSEDPEFDVLLGECLTDDAEESKRVLNHSYKQHPKDTQLLLALGNAHLQSALRKPSDETSLKTSYKFFCSILGEHRNNAYAANGLGIVCSQKGELAASDAIFSKLRQVHLPRVFSDALDMNLAFVYFQQKRFSESERQVFSVLRNALKSSTPEDVAVCLNFHCVLQRQLDLKTDANRSNLRALHFNAFDAVNTLKLKSDTLKNKRKWEE